MNNTSTTEYRELLDLARHLAGIAEEQILPRFDRCAVLAKADGSEVTEADRAAEQAIRDELARRCPDHNVWGEEYGGGFDPDRRFTWILDPIDGTANFTLGLANFGVLIGLCDGTRPVAGVVHFPALGWRVDAAIGSGCHFHRGDESRRIEVRRVETIEEIVGSAAGARDADMMLGHAPTRYRLAEIVARAKKFRFVGDCLQHSLVCRGTLHLAIDPILAPWDMAALIPCIEEAGGRASTLEGDPIELETSRSLVTTCGGPIHDLLIEHMKIGSTAHAGAAR